MAQVAQHGDHHQVADGEAALEPLLVAERVGQQLEPRLDLLDHLRPPLLRPVLAAVEDVDVDQLEDHRLDAVQRGDQPGDRRASAPFGVGRQQPLVAQAEVDQDRAAFEQLDLVVAIGRHLAERLLVEIVGRARVHRVEQADPIGPADLLERPADAQVADQPGGEVGHPAEGGDLDRRRWDRPAWLRPRFERRRALLGGRGVHPHHFPDDGRRDPRSCGRTSAAHVLLRARVGLAARPRRPCRRSHRPPRGCRATGTAAPGSVWWASAIGLRGERRIEGVGQQHDVDGVGKDHHRRRLVGELGLLASRRSPRRRRSTVEVGHRQVHENHLATSRFPLLATRFALHFSALSYKLATMQLENITTIATKRDKRRYDDACGDGARLDLIGERWALLVLRELMLGPRRFSELQSRPARDQRQRADPAAGRARGARAGRGEARCRRRPRSRSMKRPPWGLEAEPIFQALGRWAARCPRHDPTLPFSGVSILLSFRTMIDRGRGAGPRGADPASASATTAMSCGSARRRDRDRAAASIERPRPRHHRRARSASRRCVYGGAPLDLDRRRGRPRPGRRASSTCSRCRQRSALDGCLRRAAPSA